MHMLWNIFLLQLQIHHNQKNDVQLELFESPYCVYTTVWEYGVGLHDSFPQHWYYNTISFHIGNYMIFNSTNSSQDEDY